MREARKIRSLRDDQRRRMMDVLSGDVADCLDLDENQQAFRQTLWYLLTKVLFLLNIVLQFVLLGAFIGRGYNAWCWNVFISVFGMDDPYNDRWVKAPVFPTDALCDFVVRQLGNSHRHTIQCMLMITSSTRKCSYFSLSTFLLLE
uniref:Innexin n=1 Tax=Ditylenchus dipsaci TaxID=166011 RepID=A0A915DAH3_9BILA